MKSLSAKSNRKPSYEIYRNTINHDNKGKNHSTHQKMKNYSTIQTYGLCDYEYRNTIKGKLETKPNVHLKFENQVDRKELSSTIWYNKDL